jgi:hypothetical protein
MNRQLKECFEAALDEANDGMVPKTHDPGRPMPGCWCRTCRGPERAQEMVPTFSQMQVVVDGIQDAVTVIHYRKDDYERRD